MESRFREDVYRSLADIFGTMFFVAVEESGMVVSDYGEGAGAFVEGRVEISGNGVTDIMLYFPLELARNIAANFMGVSLAEISEETVMDASREATNMVVGGILSRIDREGRCRLGIPAARMLDGFSPAEELPAADTSLYTTDYGILFLRCGSLDVCNP